MIHHAKLRLTGRCHRYPMLSKQLSPGQYAHSKINVRFSFLCLLFLLITGAGSETSSILRAVLRPAQRAGGIEAGGWGWLSAEQRKKWIQENRMNRRPRTEIRDARCVAVAQVQSLLRAVRPQYCTSWTSPPTTLPLPRPLHFLMMISKSTKGPLPR